MERSEEQQRTPTTEDIASGARQAGQERSSEGQAGAQAPPPAEQQPPPAEQPVAPQHGLEEQQGIQPATGTGQATQHEQGLDSPQGLGAQTSAPQAEPSPAGQAAPAASGGQAGKPESTATGADSGSEPLLDRGEADQFSGRWESIQIGFVDEPRQAVEDADGLVAEVIQRLAENFSDERARLEGQWGRGEDVATDDLRLALQRYRSFFQRLLST